MKKKQGNTQSGRCLIAGKQVQATEDSSLFGFMAGKFKIVGDVEAAPIPSLDRRQTRKKQVSHRGSRKA